MERGEKRRFDADNDEGDRGRTGQASRADLAGKRKKVIGPSLPPPSATENINNEEIQENESESDSDDIGPTLPPTDSVSPKIPIGDEIPHMSKQEPIHSNETQRDKWMLQPPGSTDWTTKVDPTKLRNRRFQSGKLAKASTVGEGIDTSWTEMPGEKMKRLQDEVMGVTGPAGVNKLGTTNTSRMKGVMEKRMQEYNDMMRKDTLYDNFQHQSRNVSKDDDPSMRTFDREKDMALSSRLSSSQRREMLDRAANFGSRFTKGKFL